MVFLRLLNFVRACSRYLVLSQYLSTVVGTILLYDYTLTFPDEVRLGRRVVGSLPTDAVFP
jgi:hypothetical protein